MTHVQETSHKIRAFRARLVGGAGRGRDLLARFADSSRGQSLLLCKRHCIHKLQALHCKLCNEIQGGMLTFAPQRQTLSRPRSERETQEKRQKSAASSKSRWERNNEDSTRARNLRSVRGHAGTTCTVRRGLAWRVWPRRRRLRPPRRLAFRDAESPEVSHVVSSLRPRVTLIALPHADSPWEPCRPSKSASRTSNTSSRPWS